MRLIGEQPLDIDPIQMTLKTFIEVLTNLSGVYWKSRQSICLSANWMWANPHRDPVEGGRMYCAARTLSSLCQQAEIAIDGGKDSLSMSVPANPKKSLLKTIESPGTLVLTAYVHVPDINLRVQPYFCHDNSDVWYYPINVPTSSTSTQIEDFLQQLDAVQSAIKQMLLLSLHDCSDGGLIACLLEMVIGSQYGFTTKKGSNLVSSLQWTSDKPGWVFETNPRIRNTVLAHFEKYAPLAYVPVLFGQTTIQSTVCLHPYLTTPVPVQEFRAAWESTSQRLDLQQSNKETVGQATLYYNNPLVPDYQYNPTITPPIPEIIQPLVDTPTGTLPQIRRDNFTAAVIREEGTNGDREMMAALHQAGYRVYDYSMRYLEQHPTLLTGVQLDCFCGWLFF